MARRRRTPGKSSAFKAIERDLERHLQVLAGLVDSGGLPAAEIEARLGWQRGHVRQLLSRQLPLEYGELLAILLIIGVEPRRYFALVTSPETES